MIFDPLYLLLMAPGLLLALWAQWKVKSAYDEASREPAPVTGAQAARAILDHEGLHNVNIEWTEGHLSDHYDPGAKVLRLSAEVYQSQSLAAVGIAAHEAGHAIQDARQYLPLAIRGAAVPLASVGSNVAMLVFIGGLVFSTMGLLIGKGMLLVGIALFSAVVFFQLVNLPVEFDASSRGKAALADMGFVRSGHDAAVVNRVLSAAAMTYVAATISAVLTLLYMLIRSGLLGGRD